MPIGFLQLVKCTSTGVINEDKKTLRRQILAMGGQFGYDLTADVRVLVVGEYTTEKYRFCAKHRDNIIFLRPEGIARLYSDWSSGMELTTKMLRRYESPVFDKMTFCLSKLAHDLDEGKAYSREYIDHIIRKNGGKTSDSLTQGSCYVITVTPTGSRYNKALEWRIPVVHARWVIDSVTRGALLEAKYYKVAADYRPDEMSKKACNVWDRLPESSMDLMDISNSLFQECKNKPRALLRFTSFGSLLAGMCFLAYGFSEDQLSKLISVIEQLGGEVVSEYCKDATYLMVPSTMLSHSFPFRLQTLIKDEHLTVVNEWLVDRCNFYKQTCFDSWSIPRPFGNLELGLRICVTGFSGVELLHITKLIDLIGCTRLEIFEKKCSLLVVNLGSIGLNKQNSPKLFSYKFSDVISTRLPADVSNTPTKMKIKAAKKWGIPVVSLAYLWQITEKGSLPNLLDYQWCIYGPKSSMPAHNLIEYARGVTKGTFETQRKKLTPPKDNTAVAAPPRLPSPRKNKKKRWPRVVGTAIESQLKLSEKHSSGNRLDSSRSKRIRKVMNDDRVTYGMD